MGDFVAPLNENQTRQLLIEQRQTRAKQNLADQQTQVLSAIGLLKGINNPNAPLGQAIYASIESADSYFTGLLLITQQLLAGLGLRGVLKLAGFLVVVLGVAFLTEYLCMWRFICAQRVYGKPQT